MVAWHAALREQWKAFVAQVKMGRNAATEEISMCTSISKFHQLTLSSLKGFGTRYVPDVSDLTPFGALIRVWGTDLLWRSADVAVLSRTAAIVCAGR